MRGGVTTGQGAEAIIGGNLLVRGRVSLSRSRVRAGPTIVIGESDGGMDSTGPSFMEIEDDEVAGLANKLSLLPPSVTQADGGVSAAGALLLLYNGDADATTGDADIPPGAMQLLIFTGASWKPLSAVPGPVRPTLKCTLKFDQPVCCTW